MSVEMYGTRLVPVPCERVQTGQRHQSSMSQVADGPVAMN